MKSRILTGICLAIVVPLVAAYVFAPNVLDLHHQVDAASRSAGSVCQDASGTFRRKITPLIRSGREGLDGIVAQLGEMQVGAADSPLADYRRQIMGLRPVWGVAALLSILLLLRLHHRPRRRRPRLEARAVGTCA